MTVRIGSLCSGIGGLDLAAEHLTGGTTAWHAEIDPEPARVLEAHWPGVPNLGDFTTTDWSTVEPVDVLTAGYPCQPFSHAGRRQGTHDDRHLWPDVARCIRALRPRLVLLENVSGHLSLGFGDVLGDLAEAGYDAEWVCVRASDVGACHARLRVFVAAWPAAPDPDGERREGSITRSQGHDLRSDPGPAPDTDSGRRGTGEPHHAEGQPDAPWRPSTDASDLGRERGGQPRHRGTGPAHHDRDPVQWGRYEPAIRRHEHILGRPHPDPVDDKRRLTAAFVEWMMMYPEGWVDPIPTSKRGREGARLKALGNAVVWPQAVHAYSVIFGLDAVATPGDVALLPTPVAHDDGKSPEAHAAMKGRMGRQTITSPSVLAKAGFDNDVAALLPKAGATPCTEP